MSSPDSSIVRICAPIFEAFYLEMWMDLEERAWPLSRFLSTGRIEHRGERVCYRSPSSTDGRGG